MVLNHNQNEYKSIVDSFVKEHEILIDVFCQLRLMD
jgi:hypothetical protein